MSNLLDHTCPICGTHCAKNLRSMDNYRQQVKSAHAKKSHTPHQIVKEIENIKQKYRTLRVEYQKRIETITELKNKLAVKNKVIANLDKRLSFLEKRFKSAYGAKALLDLILHVDSPFNWTIDDIKKFKKEHRLK